MHASMPRARCAPPSGHQSEYKLILHFPFLTVVAAAYTGLLQMLDAFVAMVQGERTQ